MHSNPPHSHKHSPLRCAGATLPHKKIKPSPLAAAPAASGARAAQSETLFSDEQLRRSRDLPPSLAGLASAPGAPMTATAKGTINLASGSFAMNCVFCQSAGHTGSACDRVGSEARRYASLCERGTQDLSDAEVKNFCIRANLTNPSPSLRPQPAAAAAGAASKAAAAHDDEDDVFADPPKEEGASYQGSITQANALRQQHAEHTAIVKANRSAEAVLDMTSEQRRAQAAYEAAAEEAAAAHPGNPDLPHQRRVLEQSEAVLEQAEALVEPALEGAAARLSADFQKAAMPMPSPQHALAAEAPQPQSTATQWEYVLSGRTDDTLDGRASAEAIRALLADGTLQGEDQARRLPGGSWASINSYTELRVGAVPGRGAKPAAPPAGAAASQLAVSRS
eukprot:COSAG04_NODE_1139_length_8094_cov_4.952095_1_plen_393_part_10